MNFLNGNFKKIEVYKFRKNVAEIKPGYSYGGLKNSWEKDSEGDINEQHNLTGSLNYRGAIWMKIKKMVPGFPASYCGVSPETILNQIIRFALSMLWQKPPCVAMVCR